MINFLKSDLSEAALIQILRSAPRQPLLPPLGSAEWGNAAANPVIQRWMRPLTKRAEAERDVPLPALTDDLYADFFRTGERLRFELVYFERRRRLARVGMCALIDRDSARWIPSLIAKVADIANEDAWALPGHVRTESGKDPMLIDLFAAETANLLAEMINVFGQILPQELQARIQNRLRVQIFDNYINQYGKFWWTLDWCSNNWNAVCHQGVIGAALAVVDDAELLAKMLLLMRRSLPIYPGGFKEDGACSEGPLYWDYGFGWLAVLNEQLEKRTGTLSLFEQDDHIREIAKYGPRVSLPFFNFANFSDAAPGGILRPSTLAYLGQRLNDASCRSRANVNYRYLATKDFDLDSERRDFLYFARLFLHCPSNLTEAMESPPQDFYFRDLQVVIAHGRDASGCLWDFAAKAGHNDEHHNHNDCGSYILNVDGRRFIFEIGQPEYVKDYFSERRYEFLAARTLGHSLPIINGHEQAAGKAITSRVIACELADKEVKFSVDATHAYPATAGCLKYVRHFHFDKLNGQLVVRDEFDLAAACVVETSIISEHAATIVDGAAEITIDGLTLRIDPFPGTIADRVERHSYSDHVGKPSEISRIVFVPASPSDKVVLGYAMELAT